MPGEEVGGPSLFSLPMVFRGWDQFWVTIFTVSWPLAQVLCELPGSNMPLSLWVHSVSQSQAQSLVQAGCSSAQLLSLWACAAEIILKGEPVAAGGFLRKQLPALLKKCTAFHTAQLSNQSRDYLSQGLT